MKLSIVIPAYNVENHITRTLDSIACQTEKKFELIIVNDGSTDATCDVIQERLQGNLEFDYKLITKENGGVSSARNRGLMEALGEYVMFLDGDDYIANSLIEKIYDLLESDAPDVLYWGYNMVKEDKTKLENYFEKYKHIQKPVTGIEALKNIYVNRNMWICTGSAAFRKQILNENQLAYPVGCSNCEDQEFTIKVLSKADRVVFIDEVLSFYVSRDESMTNSCNIKKFDAIGALRRACSYLDENKNEDLKKMADIIGTNILVENFFNNFDSCITNSKVGCLIDEIDERYPDLNQEVNKAMRLYRGSENKLKIKSRLFLTSPKLYAELSYLKQRMSF